MAWPRTISIVHRFLPSFAPEIAGAEIARADASTSEVLPEGITACDETRRCPFQRTLFLSCTRLLSRYCASAGGGGWRANHLGSAVILPEVDCFDNILAPFVFVRKEDLILVSGSNGRVTK